MTWTATGQVAEASALPKAAQLLPIAYFAIGFAVFFRALWWQVTKAARTLHVRSTRFGRFGAGAVPVPDPTA